MAHNYSPKDFRISPKTEREIAIVRLESGIRFMANEDYAAAAALDRALYGVRRAEMTGRLAAGARIALRRMTGYQYAKLVFEFVGLLDLDHIAPVLNARYADVTI